MVDDARDGAHRARACRRAGAPRAVLRRRAAAGAAPRRTPVVERRDQRGDGRPGRPSHHRAAAARTRPMLDAAQAVAADLPFACKGGVCGTCRALVADGEVDMRRNYALEQAEVDAGFVLTCQSLPGQRRRHRRLRRLTRTARPYEGPMSRAVVVEEAEDRVVLRLNRPEVRNAIDQQTVDRAARGLRAARGGAPGGAARRRGRHLRGRRRHRPAARTPTRGRAARHQLQHLRPDPAAADADDRRCSTGTRSAAAPSSPTPATSGSARPDPDRQPRARARASSPPPAPPGGWPSWSGSRWPRRSCSPAGSSTPPRRADLRLLTEVVEPEELLAAGHRLGGPDRRAGAAGGPAHQGGLPRAPRGAPAASTTWPRRCSSRPRTSSSG